MKKNNLREIGPVVYGFTLNFLVYLMNEILSDDNNDSKLIIR